MTTGWRTLFVTNGSPPIRNAIEDVFPNAVQVRQFHGNHLGLVFTHFRYGGTPHTLIIRWDIFVNEERIRIRRATPGENLLEKDEFLLYTGFIPSPANMGLTGDPESDKLKGLGSTIELRSLPQILTEDLQEYKNRDRGRWSSKLSRLVRSVNRAKPHQSEQDAEIAAENITKGLKAALELDFGKWPKKYRGAVYNRLKALSLPGSSGAVKEFREARKRLMEKLNRGLVKTSGRSSGKTRRRERTRWELVCRGRLSEDPGVAERVPALGYILRILKRVFKNKYITTNQVEGCFGREGLRFRIHRAEVGTPSLVELICLIITKGGFTILDAVRLAPTRVQGRRLRRGNPRLPKLRVGDRSEIGYVDQHGVFTSRRVKVLRVLKFGSSRRKQYIEAHCKLRNRKRTFRLDRIISIKPLH